MKRLSVLPAQASKGSWVAEHFLLGLLMLLVLGVMLGIIAVGLLVVIQVIATTMAMVFESLGGG